MQTTARSLILDLLSTLRRGSMPVRALIEAGLILGLEENNVRVSLTRLCASGRVERDERGRYRLGPAVAEMSGRLRSWRELGGRTTPWKGDWLAVHQPRLGQGSARKRLENALALLGLRELDVGLYVRPDNLRGGVDAARSSVLALSGSEGQDTTAPASALCLFRIQDLDEASDAAARKLWDAPALALEARLSMQRLQASADHLPKMSDTEAMLESFLVGGHVLRQLMRHPLLPSEILDPEPLAQLLLEMKRYDRLGRDAWSKFLANHDVPHRALPLDARHLDRDLGPRTQARPEPRLVGADSSC